MIEFVRAFPFDVALKKLAKKYRSIEDDIEGLTQDLQDNPKQGADLGNGLRKVRMAIASKNKGKSGGARVERSTITDKELRLLLEAIV